MARSTAAQNTSAKTVASKTEAPSLDTKSRPSRRRGKDTFEVILTTAGELLAEVGFERLTTNLVCERAGLTPPARWGQEDYLTQLFGASASDIHVIHRDFVFRYPSPQHWVDVFRSWYGPVHKAFATLDAGGQRRLEQDLLALIAEFNTSGDATMVVPGEYVEAIIVKR